MPKNTPIITICSSAYFYKKAIAIQDELEHHGFEAIVPFNATIMHNNNDFEVSQYRTWLTNPEDYHKKAEFIRRHFAEVEKCDAILVINDEKNGKPNYIGGNVLMEMSLAFHLKKPVFILNAVPLESIFLEEILGMLPVVLNGSLDGLYRHYGKSAKKA